MSTYFIRVNGDTGHNNPGNPDCFVPGEPPGFPRTAFNYFQRCLEQGFVRIGWPDVGDLSVGNGHGALSHCYRLPDLEPYIQRNLLRFADIPKGSTILMPNKANSGDLAIGTTVSAYFFFHQVPQDPHRIRVQWDTDSQGEPIVYRARRLGIPTTGGFWRRAFSPIQDSTIITQIEAARPKRV